MTLTARELAQALLAARSAGSSEELRALLAPDASYWDCLTGRVRGAEAVTRALLTSHAGNARPRFVAELLAVGGGHAVTELRVCDAQAGDAPGYPATEVYELRAGLVAACRTYLDPAGLRGG